MKIIHTSDWHLGKKLYGKSRYEESELFLEWLVDTVEKESADALIISGDIFDTVSPSNRALGQYYNFLYKISASCCENVIITAGNHDSPSLLNAPKDLLKAFNVHVIGNAADNLSDEIIVLKNKNNIPDAVVCAVPYLREKDLRMVNQNESTDDKSIKMLNGIKEHYFSVVSLAEEVCKSKYSQEKIKKDDKKRLPLIVTGHLFASGGVTLSGDGVREIYIGNLERAGCDIFPSGIDYLALGHLHVPQKVFGFDNKRYSGSPVPVGFSEAKQKKMIISVEFEDDKQVIKEIYVPNFRRLLTISGNLDEIKDEIQSLNFSLFSNSDPKLTHSNITLKPWAEIIYTGNTASGDIREEILEITNESSIEVLRIKNESLSTGILTDNLEGDSLESLTEHDVFQKCLETSKTPEELWPELKQTFSEALLLLHEEDLFKD